MELADVRDSKSCDGDIVSVRTRSPAPSMLSGGKYFFMSSSTSSFLTVFLPLILFFVIMWLFLVRPQRKKDKETKEMRNSLQVGDSIVTIGGIIGKVLAVKDDSVVIYCGTDKTKMEFKKWAIAEVTNKDSRAVKAEKAAEKAEKEEKARLEKEAAEAEKKEEPAKIRKLKRKDDEPAEK